MLPARLMKHEVFLRELTPQDLKLEIDVLTRTEAVRAARYLATVVGHAHGRQMDPASRRSWAKAMGRGQSKSLAAPSWLWGSLVELVGVHEAAYLEFCRTFALQSA